MSCCACSDPHCQDVTYDPLVSKQGPLKILKGKGVCCVEMKWETAYFRLRGDLLIEADEEYEARASSFYPLTGVDIEDVDSLTDIPNLKIYPRDRTINHCFELRWGPYDSLTLMAESAEEKESWKKALSNVDESLPRESYCKTFWRHLRGHQTFLSPIFHHPNDPFDRRRRIGLLVSTLCVLYVLSVAFNNAISDHELTCGFQTHCYDSCVANHGEDGCAPAPGVFVGVGTPDNREKVANTGRAGESFYSYPKEGSSLEEYEYCANNENTAERSCFYWCKSAGSSTDAALNSPYGTSEVVVRSEDLRSICPSGLNASDSVVSSYSSESRTANYQGLVCVDPVDSNACLRTQENFGNFVTSALVSWFLTFIILFPVEALLRYSAKESLSVTAKWLFSLGVVGTTCFITLIVFIVQWVKTYFVNVIRGFAAFSLSLLIEELQWMPLTLVLLWWSERKITKQIEKKTKRMSTRTSSSALGGKDSSGAPGSRSSGSVPLPASVSPPPPPPYSASLNSSSVNTNTSMPFDPAANDERPSEARRPSQSGAPPPTTPPPVQPRKASQASGHDGGGFAYPGAPPAPPALEANNPPPTTTDRRSVGSGYPGSSSPPPSNHVDRKNSSSGYPGAKPPVTPRVGSQRV